MDPMQLLEIMKGAAGGQAPTFRLGTIPAGYTSGWPTVLFDGESTPGTRTYPHLESYTPAAGDRVLIASVGVSGGGVILGKIA